MDTLQLDLGILNEEIPNDKETTETKETTKTTQKIELPDLQNQPFIKKPLEINKKITIKQTEITTNNNQKSILKIAKNNSVFTHFPSFKQDKVLQFTELFGNKTHRANKPIRKIGKLLDTREQSYFVSKDDRSLFFRQISTPPIAIQQINKSKTVSDKNTTKTYANQIHYNDSQDLFSDQKSLGAFRPLGIIVLIVYLFIWCCFIYIICFCLLLLILY